MDKNIENPDGIQSPQTNVTKFISIGNQPIVAGLVFKSNRVTRLYNWWKSFHPAIPQENDFDITNHIADMPFIFRYKVHSINEFEIRLNGEKAVEIVGIPNRGVKVTTETIKQYPDLEQLFHYLQQICEDKSPLSCLGTFKDQFERLQNFESIDIPLLDKEGNVSYIIGIIDNVT